MLAGKLGLIETPYQQGAKDAKVRLHDARVPWIADNGCFGKTYVGDAKWFAWLTRSLEAYPACSFAVAPDVVGDAAATLKRSAGWLPRIRDIGGRAAFVGQDGQEDLPVPWSTFDVLFLGGTTDWKLGPGAACLAREAVERGVPVHMGRVNTLRRLRIAKSLGCTSVDGTYITFGPDKNVARLLPWLELVEREAAG